MPNQSTCRSRDQPSPSRPTQAPGALPVPEPSSAPLRTTAEQVGQHVPGMRVASGLRAGSNPATGWTDVLVEIYRRRRVEESIVVPATAEPQVILVLAGTVLAEERELDGGSPWSGRTVTAGEFFLTTTPTPYEVRWRTLSTEDYETMHVFIGLPVFARAARAVHGTPAAAGAGVLALREVFGERDPILSALLEPLRAEVTAPVPPAAGALFLQGLAQSLAVHLLRTYPASGAAGGPERRGGLPAYKLRKVTDYLEAHLAEEVSLARLAGEAGLSPFHFSRLFKTTTGFSPSRYLTRLRMTRARHLLRETTRSMIEVGLEVGYTSPSYFARAFRDETGVTPSAYRRGGSQ